MLIELSSYIKKTLNLDEVDILTTSEALAKVEQGVPNFTKSIVESSEPGNPGLEYYNVQS